MPAIVRTAPEPTPYRAHRLERALPQPRMRREPEIVVGGEIDDRAAVERRARGLLALKTRSGDGGHCSTQLVELGIEEGQRVRAHGAV